MALVYQDFTLEVTPGAIPHVLNVTEYDINMQIDVTFTQRGQPYEIPSGTTAKVEGTIAGHPFRESCVVNGNTVTFILTENMTAYAGRAWTKIVLTKDNWPVSTCGFWLDVDRAGVEAGDVIGAPGFEEQIREAAEDWLEDQGFQSPTVSITPITGGNRVTFTDAQHPQGQSIDVMDGESGAEVDATLTHSGEAADAKVVGDALAIKADLPQKKTAVTLSPQPGRMTTNLTVFGTQYQYASIPVSGGQKYVVTGWCSSNSIPAAFTVNGNNQVTKLLGTNNTTYENAEITIPEGAVTLYINGTADGKISATLLGDRFTQQEFADIVLAVQEVQDNVDDFIDSAETTYANLPYALTPVELTVEQGWISTALNVYGSDFQKHTSIDVNSGETYAVSGTGAGAGSSAAYPCAFTVDSSNKPTILLGNGYFFNEIIVIPDGAVKLYVNNSQEKLINIQSATLITQAAFSAKMEKLDGKMPNLKFIFRGSSIDVKRKYDSEKDLMLTLGNSSGGNNLWNFLSLSFVGNTEKEPNNHFVGYTGIQGWNLSASDWIGPYVVAAKNNINGDNPTSGYFTGGNHQTNNSGTGGAITAAQQSISVLINGVKEAEQGIIYSCESVVIRWKNLIQAYNTTKSDGSGRGVMTEEWEAVIDNDRIKLRNKITALEDVTISTYYGFQMTSPSSPKYSFIGGANRGVYTALSGSGSTIAASGNKTCRKAVLYNDYYHCEVGVEPYDLGLFEHLNDGSSSFFPSNGKLYSNLIWTAQYGGTPLDLNQGESAYLYGYYRFY